MWRNQHLEEVKECLVNFPLFSVQIIQYYSDLGKYL